jgi:hypothetical protein
MGMKLFQHIAFPLVALLLGITSASGENSRSVVPMTLVQSDYGGGRVYLSVQLGNALGKMRLDTGASTSRIMLASWNKDLPSLGESESTGASGRTTPCDDVEAENVALKASEGNDIARAKYVVTRCAASDGDDLLGLDFFKNARFTLDFEHHEMVFFGEPFATGRAKPFRLLSPDRRLVGIDLRAGKTAAVGLFDTGAEICAVDLRFVQRHKRSFSLVKSKGKASEVGGKRISSKIYKIKKLDLGDGRVLRDLYALAYDFGPLRKILGRDARFILGYNLVSKLYWELDFRTPNSPTWNARLK